MSVTDNRHRRTGNGHGKKADTVGGLHLHQERAGAPTDRQRHPQRSSGPRGGTVLVRRRRGTGVQARVAPQISDFDWKARWPTQTAVGETDIQQ